mgnify:FL=1
MAALMAFAGISINVSAKTADTSTQTTPQKTEAMQFVEDMGIGINLGNTFEACGDWIAQWGDGTVHSYETAWGSPIITEKIIKGYKDSGFNTLRVPVSWSNMMGDDYTISSEYANAVKQVVDWAMAQDMYVIVNLHYDNGWLENFPTQKEECMYRYKRIWQQVSDVFKDYDERLVFEGQNEELGWSSVWNQWGGTKGKAKSYALVNEINQTFVDVVRASGGKNKARYLLIPGYNTGIETTVDKLYKVPKDKEKHVIISVHYYSPATFAILTDDASWGKNQRTWGTDSDINELKKSMDMLKKRFLDNGIPVIIGEYGCPMENKDINSVRKYLSKVCEEAYSMGMCPVLWSTPGHIYDREACKISDKIIEANYRKIVKKGRK